MAVIPDSLNAICSSNSNVLSFSYTKSNCVPLTILTTLATAPEEDPINVSPIIALFVNVSLWDETTIEGKSGFAVSFDSNIPKISRASGTFKEIVSSWTLVPYTALNVSPSLKVVDPIPAPAFWDLSMIRSEHLVTVFTFDVNLVLFAVTVNVAFPVLDRLIIVICFKSAVIVTWELLISSFSPVCQVKM